MGWYSVPGKRSDVIKELTQSEISVCVKHCYRGNAFSGVLWAVWNNGRENLITCDILMFQQGGSWYHKPLDESMYPHRYSCPLSYLKMTPNVACVEWRELVYQYHAKRRERRL